MDIVKPRSDDENARQLSIQMEIYQRLRAQKAVCENDVRRLTSELEAASKDAEARFGTSDITRLRSDYVEGQIRNTKVVQEFTESLQAIEEALAQISAEQSEMGVNLQEVQKPTVFVSRKN